MAPPLKSLLAKFFSPLVEESVRKAFSTSENDNTFFVGTRQYDESDRDRLDYDRSEILDQCLEAWRQSPLGRRIVELTSQYVIGSGMDIKCAHEKTKAFLSAFWSHRLNRMDSRVTELCDELSRSGNLFLLVSTDRSGMSFIRTLPAADIDQIVPAENDIEQAASFITKANDQLQTHVYPAYNPLADVSDEKGHFAPVVLHYAVNRPAGAQWGESDLAPLLPWLRRYAAWLEDRVRLNRFRNAFLYVVSGSFVSEEARQARQALLAANPPSPGSILVCDASETWSVISPKLEALDAMQDGLAIKKLIASGAGLPLHFLAEPEGSNRTTAESAGGPTFRRFEQRQRYFMWLISDLLHVVVSRRALVDRQVDPDAGIQVSGADISTRDNVAHSIASVNILNALERLKDRGLINDRELLRVVYRFAGEPADVDALLAGGSGEDVRQDQEPIRPVTKQPVEVGSGMPKTAVLP